MGWEQWSAAMEAGRETVDLVEGGYVGEGEPVLVVRAIDGWHGRSETVTEAEAIARTLSRRSVRSNLEAE